MRIVAFLALALVYGCGVTRLSTLAEPQMNSSSDADERRINVEYAVYSAIVDSLYRRANTQLVVVVDRTLPARPSPIWDIAAMFGRDAPYLSHEAIADFLEINEQPIRLERPLDVPLPTVLLSPVQLTELIPRADWEAFHERYSGANGFIRFSRVGLSPAQDQAVVYVDHRYGNLGGQIAYVVLLREQQGWRIRDFLRMGGS